MAFHMEKSEQFYEHCQKSIFTNQALHYSTSFWVNYKTNKSNKQEKPLTWANRSMDAALPVPLDRVTLLCMWKERVVGWALAAQLLLIMKVVVISLEILSFSFKSLVQYSSCYSGSPSSSFCTAGCQAALC